MTEVQVMVFNKQNALLAYIEPEIQLISWRLNNVGLARFTLAYTDSKCTETNLRFGNRLLCRFNNGLPDWGGVIDEPRRRDTRGITFTAYTGEKFFDWRTTPKGRYFDNAAPGYIFERLIIEENAIRPTGVTTESIYKGGLSRTLEYHYHDMLKRFIDLARLTGQDFAVVPSYSGGKIYFYAYWYERRGSDKSANIWLSEGANVASVTLDEQGQIANSVTVVGEGTTWGDERLDANERDADSIALYDFREWAEVQSGVTTQATVDANAEALLDEMKDARVKFTLTVTDDEPGTFAEYGVGDRLRLMAFLDWPEWAYDGTVRVTARQWTPDDVCKLEVEEWT